MMDERERERERETTLLRRTGGILYVTMIRRCKAFRFVWEIDSVVRLCDTVVLVVYGIA